MNDAVHLHSNAEVQAFYAASLSQHQQAYNAIARRYGLIFKVMVAAIFAAAALLFSPIHLPSLWPLLVSAIVFAVLIASLMHLKSAMEWEQRLVHFYERNHARASGAQLQSGRTGFERDQDRPPHIYERDLDILGPNSLFGLLATVRTTLAERGLAGYLLHPAAHQESVDRQQAVQELAPLAALREKIAMLGASDFQQLSTAFIDDWLNAEPLLLHPAYRIALFAAVAINLVLLLLGAFHVFTWETAVQNVALVLVLQSAIALTLRPRLHRILDTSARLNQNVQLIAEGIALIQSCAFRSSKLLHLQSVLSGPPAAAAAFKRLGGSLGVLEQRKQGLYFVIYLFLAGGTQASISIAAWKRQHAASMRLWLEAWSEFEALNALATYAFEHPEHAWPELLPSTHPPTFHASSLKHPLLPAAIPNDIALDAATRFYLISGSNMSGKSTLLRAIGINAVLAYAGAPVSAASLRLTPLALGASIALVDSLAEGRSKFLAEVERLGAILHSDHAAPVLFLVDEIFSGTNSEDRRTAAHAILQQLLAASAIGALSTHDLALTSLVTPENAGRNVHMASPDAADPLAFDYRLKPGVNTASSALAILHMVGIDV